MSADSIPSTPARDDVRAEPPEPPPTKAGHPTGRHRWRWLVPVLLLAVWLVAGGAAGPASGKLSQVQKNDASSFLPENAESATVTDLQATFASSQAFPGFLLVESDRTLTPAHLRAVADFARQLPELEVPVTDQPSVRVGDFLLPGPSPVIPSQDGRAVLVLINFDGELDATLADGESPLQKSVEAIRAADDSLAIDGARVYVSGPAGVIADLVEAFGGIDGILVLVALIAVLVILLVVYRSPIVPFMVLISAAMAYTLAGGLVYVLAKNEVITLDGQGQGILSILVIGAATDYALLLVARFREELRRHDDRYEAMWLAWRRSFEPILASGSTVIAGLLCLLVSNLGPTRGLGPVGAVGIAAAMASALTLLPAILLAPGLLVGLAVTGAAAGATYAAVASGSSTSVAIGAALGVGIAVAAALALVERLLARRREARRHSQHQAVEAGRWVFWPAIPHMGTVGPESTGLWAKVSRQVGRSPRRAWIGSAILLLILAAFLPTLKAEGTTQSDIFLTEVESVTGDSALALHFPAGSGSPTIVIGPAELSDRMIAAVRATEGVSAVVPVTEGSAAPKVVDGRVQLQVTLVDNADSPEADETVRRLRSELDAVSPQALVGGTTAQNLDVRDLSAQDLTRIIPLILLVIFLVLALLLRSLVAPALLIVSNVLSFAATLGASALVFNYVVDFPGSDPTVPLYGFVFLVALGIDYSIFLMTRVREESLRQGTRPGILTGLAVTGGVITSAGIVLAATFAALGVLPILFLAQIAFIVAFGVLLDTFVVRSLLVPALSYEIGPRIWWPSRLATRESGPEND